MGQVYRARDTKLDRDVAIKILPEALAHDADRLARFTREAKTLASLNHPNIGAIYGIEGSGGGTALVMELVEGEDLSQELEGLQARGLGLPVDDALLIAKQIAEALEAAHTQGVIHRDLKPANIKLRRDGTVKVLDFGLAKAQTSASEVAHTVTAVGTQIGVILGTPAYMSPEQARGELTDKRADIWAFGCVLYQMLSGRNAFGAGSPSEAIARVLEREPDWDALPSSVPDAIRRLLKRCLRKDPTTRLHDIADARIEIADTLSEADATDRRVGPPKANRWPWIAAATAIAAAALVVSVVRPSPSPRKGLLEFPIDLVDTADLGVAVSPDGRQVAFATYTAGGVRLSLHALDKGVTRALPEAQSGLMPFWSPNSSTLGFFAMDGKLKRVDVADGTTAVIANASGPGGGSWNAEGVLLFSDNLTLFRLSPVNSAPAPVDIVDESGPSAIRTFPQFLEAAVTSSITRKDATAATSAWHPSIHARRNISWSRTTRLRTRPPLISCFYEGRRW
jgi:eukaryotic-like serine/threonine-protein kinase